MDSTPLRILLIDDDEDDYIITRDLLTESGSDWYALTWVADYDAAHESMLNVEFDLFLVDYRLGERNGLELLRAIRAGGCAVPAIILTGTGDYQVDVEAMKAGAVDYLVKDRIDSALLERAIRYAVERARGLQALREAQNKLEAAFTLVQRNQDDMLAILNQLRLGIVMTDREGCVTFLSRACQRLLGHPQNMIGTHWAQLCPFEEKDQAQLKAMLARPPAQREKLPVHLKATGQHHYWMEVEIQDDPREPQRKIFFLYDMTEVHDLRSLLKERAHFQDLVGKSEPMQAVYQHIIDLAKVDATVLIEGATGTGKELVARAIHTSSARQAKPFIAVNCAGLSESLLGSQLFGHKRGAFTGAVADQTGVFETADGGTVFLDEIGDISPSVQTSLLRVLQEKEITRLGDVRPQKVDVRIIAATHRDLNQEVAEQRFRMDLLYRIRVARIQLPPLSERRVDIPLLVEAFLRKFQTATGRAVEGVSDEALALLLNHSWPGNVRELQSAIECAVIQCKGPLIQPGDLPPELTASLPALATSGDPQEQERQRVRAALQSARGNRAVAARMLGMSRSTLYRRLSELQIDPD
ncbi:MAG: sigma 54-interacting transcriptional regulator [Planctomycetota bacterium]